MSRIELALPDRITGEIDRLVEEGEFMDRERAVEELLTRGVSAYTTTASTEEDEEFGGFGQTVDDQQDPAMRDEPDQGDDYSF